MGLKGKKKIYDTIVVGGGPAGLSCALLLGRCLRSVLVFDTGLVRNRFSESMHAFPSRDGEHPQVFLNKIKSELRVYGIRVWKREIISARKTNEGFELKDGRKEKYYCKKLLLATGLVDVLPPLDGIEKYYGRGVFHCPYCDGWENRKKPWAVYAVSARPAVEVCLRLKTWTDDVTLLSAYTKGLKKTDQELLLRNGISLKPSPVAELQGKRGNLNAIRFENGDVMPCEALFFSTVPKQHSGLAEQLGCRRTRKGNVDFDKLQQTNVPGLFAAGDMARDMQLVLIAAAEGAKAAVVINAVLNKEQRKLSGKF